MKTIAFPLILFVSLTIGDSHNDSAGGVFRMSYRQAKILEQSIRRSLSTHDDKTTVGANSSATQGILRRQRQPLKARLHVKAPTAPPIPLRKQPTQKSTAVSLFNGKNLEGWEVRPSDAGAGHWIVHSGVIVAENRDKMGSILWTQAEYRDFDLTLEFKSVSDYYDSGVFLRSKDHQVQIGISGSLKKDMTGCIYAPRDDRGAYPARSDKSRSLNRAGEWNRLSILVQDNRIRTYLNGTAIVDYQATTIKNIGPIGLQLHTGRHMKILFRNLSMSDLSLQRRSRGY